MTNENQLLVTGNIFVEPRFETKTDSKNSYWIKLGMSLVFFATFSSGVPSTSSAQGLKLSNTLRATPGINSSYGNYNKGMRIYGTHNDEKEEVQVFQQHNDETYSIVSTSPTFMGNLPYDNTERYEDEDEVQYTFSENEPITIVPSSVIFMGELPAHKTVE